MDGVARGGGFGDDAVGPVAETRGGTAHRGPGRVDVFEEVVETVAVRVPVGAVGVGGRGCIEAVGSFPAVGHAVTVGVPAGGVFVDVAVAVVVVGGAVSIAIVVRVSRINKAVLVVVKAVGADVANRVLVAEDDGAGTVRARGAASGLIELHGVFLVPVVHRDGAVPPHTVVKHGGGVGVVPARRLKVEVLLEVGHAVAVWVGHGAVHAVGGERVETVFPFPSVW